MDTDIMEDHDMSFFSVMVSQPYPSQIHPKMDNRGVLTVGLTFELIPSIDDD
jgi:hypothetical protein